MAYYKNKNIGREAALRHIEEYRQLEKKLGVILSDVRNIFFNLSKDDLHYLLGIYREKYGDSAYEYALNTYDKWRQGVRKMSGQTARRLLNLIPPLLSAETRYQLVKKLCDHHSRKSKSRVEIKADSPTEGLNSLRRAFDDAYKNVTVQIPDDILNTITWLNNDSAVATRMVLNEIDKARHQTISMIAEREIQKTTVLMKQKDIREASHTIELPTVAIFVKIIPPSGLIAKFFKTIIGR